MASDDEFKENLLNQGNPYRAFWWNVALIVAALAVVGIIVAGVISRRRANPPASPALAPAASPAVTPPAAPPPVSQPMMASQPPAVQQPVATQPPAPVDRAATAAELAALEQLRAVRQAGDRLAAREQCLDLLQRATSAEVIAQVEAMLGELNVELVLTPAAMPEKTDYVVKAGDSLAKLAKQFDTTIELIRAGNQLRGDVIRVGDRLRIFTAPFRVRVSKTRNDLAVYAGDRFFKRYRVGTGKHGTTPTGVFVINDKIAEPPWWRPDGKVVPFGDKENVLGTRWLSLKPIEDTDPVRGYGIHGTWEPETIGHQASAGCVRMLNTEVEQLYILLPLGTRVVIEE